MKLNIVRLQQGQDMPEKPLHQPLEASTGGFIGVKQTTSDAYPYPLRLVKKAPTETYEKLFLGVEESNMSALKKRFKEKLKEAKKLREKVGDPIALGKSLIEISEDEADQKLSTFKGYKYVSKKS
ncbi:MAG: hypothetical protein ABSH06_09755 [Thermodesulfobacteriota bacterium]